MPISSYFRERAQAIVDNIIAALLFGGGAVLLGWLIKHYAVVWGLDPRVAIVLAWAVALLVFVALSLLLKPKPRPEETPAMPQPAQQTLNQSGIVNETRNEANPHNEFKPTVNVNIPAAQSEEKPRRVPVQPPTPPHIEYRSYRIIRLPIDITNNNLGEEQFIEQYLSERQSIVLAILVRFYYRPDSNVPSWIDVKPHVFFQGKWDVFDAVWYRTENEYRTFETGKAYELIVALVSLDRDDLLLTYEHDRKPLENTFGQSDFFVPNITPLEGKEFHVLIELVCKWSDNVIAKPSFRFRLVLDPEPKFEEVKESDALTPAAHGRESPAKRAYKIERLKEFIKESESGGGFVPLTRENAMRIRGQIEARERFLTQYYDEATAQRCREEGVEVLHELLKELLDS
jgi:hypothetical protein